MSLHINAAVNAIAPVVLMPGDPLRAKYMAERFLHNPELVANTRNIFYYTGTYKDTRISIGASGMGCPSTGIYAYELYSSYNVKCIMRIGTAGAYTEALDVYNLVNTVKAYSESTFAREAFGYTEEFQDSQGDCSKIISDTAERMKLPLINAHVHSSDVFYRAKKGTPEIALRGNCQVVEMEAFALFATARYLNRMAGTLLTVSDVIPSGKEISPKEREQALIPMMELALESAVSLSL